MRAAQRDCPLVPLAQHRPCAEPGEVAALLRSARRLAAVVAVVAEHCVQAAAVFRVVALARLCPAVLAVASVAKPVPVAFCEGLSAMLIVLASLATLMADAQNV